MSRRYSLPIAMLIAILAFMLALPGPVLPPWPESTHDIEPAGLQPVYGKVQPEPDGSLFVTGTERDTALQVKQGLRVNAESLSVLRYSANDFPATLELALTWRRADEPLETHIATLPAPGTGSRAFALSGFPEWKGTIIELGLAQFPVPHHVPDGRGFQPFHLEALRLESPALANGIALFFDALIEPRPWTHHSINSLGRELDSGYGKPPIAALLAGLAAFAICWWFLIGRQTSKPAFRCMPVVAAAALAWLLLDMGWQARLSAQNRLTMASTADGMRGDKDLVDASDRLRDWLARHRPKAKILVLASAAYTAHRLVYLLLPLDVAVATGALRAGAKQPPARTLLVVYAPLLTTRDGHELRWPEIGMRNLMDLAQLGPLRIYEYGEDRP